MHSLCTIALYREYMAFAPFSVTTPEGPLDEPRVNKAIPYPDYWVRQARKCFGAAREFTDLLEACHRADALVDTPIAGFATYIVAWCGESSPALILTALSTDCLQLATVISFHAWTPEMHCTTGYSPVLGTLRIP